MVGRGPLLYLYILLHLRNFFFFNIEDIFTVPVVTLKCVISEKLGLFSKVFYKLAKDKERKKY